MPVVQVASSCKPVLFLELLRVLQDQMHSRIFRWHNHIRDRHNYFRQIKAIQKIRLFLPGSLHHNHVGHVYQDCHCQHQDLLHPNIKNHFSDQLKYGKDCGYPLHKFQVLSLGAFGKQIAFGNFIAAIFLYSYPKNLSPQIIRIA